MARDATKLQGDYAVLSSAILGIRLLALEKPIPNPFSDKKRREAELNSRADQRWEWDQKEWWQQRQVRNVQLNDAYNRIRAASENYSNSLAAMNRVFSAQLEKFGIQRDVSQTEREIQRRNSTRQQGQTQASFGARGISLNGNLMMSLQQEQNLLDKVAQGKLDLINNEEKVTKESQEKSRLDLNIGYNTEYNQIQTQIKVLQAQGAWVG